ncbi:hypothetical protein CK203_045826 [Vitis vinifera]|uniref:Uncharacterized protein n=1 Tax=Vitis vinifera TaxID=29760 RepID=A0A438FM27_VITVI|nr:hypothetical protein CK203_045826 [Vitis vinifera]
MPLSQAFQKLVERGLLTALALRPPPQPVPPQFKMDLHCAYHQGDGLPSPIVLEDSYEIVGVMTHSGRIVWATRPTTRPFGGTDSSKEAGAIPFSFHQKVKFTHDGEFVTTIDHDTHFGLGFTPSEDDVRYMARLRRDRVRAQLFGIPFDYPVCSYTFNLVDVRGSEIQPRIEEIVSMTIATPSPDRASLFSLCFLDETTDYGIAEGDQIVPALEIPAFVIPTIDMYEGTVGLVKGASDSMDPPLSFDFLSGFATHSAYVFDDSVMDLSIYEYSFVSCDDVLLLAPYSPTSQILDIDDEIAQHDSDERATLTIGNVEIVDFSIANQPRELKIGSPLSTDERPRSSGHLASSKRSSGGFFIKESGENAFSHEPLAISHDGEKWKVHQLHFRLSGAFRMTATRRLRHYMTEYLLHLSSRLDPLRYLFDRLTLDASLPTIKSRLVDDDFPKEEFVAMTRLSSWRMYFDGATNHSGYGIGVLLPYHAYLELLIEKFEELKYIHLPRAHIQFADTLATLASTVDIPTNVIVRPLLIKTRSAPTYCYLIDKTEVQDDLPWFHDIHQFLRSGTYPEAATAKDQRALRQLTTRFMICGETLYRRSTDGMLLLCLCRVPANRVMREVHAGVCGPHMGGHMLTLWGIDIIGKILLKSSNGHEFILVAIDYFIKWVETASYVKLTFARVANFIRSYTLLPGVRYEEWAQAQFDQLNLLDERRLRVADHIHACQRKMARAFKKRVRPRPLQKGDLVLRILRGLIGDPREKFGPSWSGPYVIRELTPEEAAWLTNLDGNQFLDPTNMD